MDTLAWAVAFILMCLSLGGSAVLCVAISEHGKTKRLVELEKTKRTGMDNAWQLEHLKVMQGELGGPSIAEYTLR